MKDKIHYVLIMFWVIFWIYLYNNPIDILWQPLLLVGMPVYLFVYLLLKLSRKKLNEAPTKVLIGYIILVALLHKLVDHNTFRPKSMAKIFVERMDAGQYRYLVLREHGKFEDYAEDWFHLSLFGIDFRESFGVGRYYKNEDNNISIYYRKFISELHYKPLNDEKVNEAIRDGFITSDSHYKTQNEIFKSELPDTTSFIKYSLGGKFKTKELKQAWVTLFPNLGSRNVKWKYNFDGKWCEFPEKLILRDVYGVNQFFMDYDLTTGFVHRNTQKFHDKLPEDGFVLLLERSTKNFNQAKITYKRKKYLTSDEKLGLNIGFCRQWKLSELDKRGRQVNMSKNVKYGKYRIQLKPSSGNRFGEIQIWSNQPIVNGYVDLTSLQSFDNSNGGTAVIIWETKEGEVYFEDIHGSIYDILSELERIAKKYKVDPTLGVYDAAGMAQKLQSKSDFTLDLSETDKWCASLPYVGAGYAFNKKQ